MATHSLVQSLTRLDPAAIDEIFGHEDRLGSLSSPGALADVRRVLIFAEAFFPKIDGVSRSAYLTLRYLQETGREVLVFAPDISPASVGESRVVALPSLGLPFAPETRVALPTLAVTRLVEEFQPDLIHLFSPAVMSLGGMIAGRRHNIPVIANYQTDLPAYTEHYGFNFLTSAMRNGLRYLHNRCHLTLVPSTYTLRQLQQQQYRRLRIWRRGVDLKRFSPTRRSAEWRSRLLHGRSPDSLLCIYVGRLATEKRVDLLLDVARLPGVALTIIGDGAERRTLEKLFAGTNTHFTGYLLGDDLANAYASADVFLFPGPSETFGQVVQEAMASGLPSVIINQGGIVDLVQDGINGYVCPADPAAFAQVVRILKRNPDLRERMAANARRLAEQYPWGAIMAQLETYYQEAHELNRRLARMHQPGLRYMLSKAYWARRKRLSSMLS